MLRIPPILGGVGSRNGMPSIANRFANAKTGIYLLNSISSDFIHVYSLYLGGCVG